MQCTDRARSPGHVASGGLFLAIRVKPKLSVKENKC